VGLGERIEARQAAGGLERVLGERGQVLNAPAEAVHGHAVRGPLRDSLGRAGWERAAGLTRMLRISYAA
jgi:hypothetical protein